MYYLAVIKILKKKWLFLSLSVGIFLFVTSACILPMFGSALQSRMLLMSFNKNTQQKQTYSNRVTYVIPMKNNNEPDKNMEEFYTNLIETNLIKKYQQPIAYFNRLDQSDFFNLTDITYAPKEASAADESTMSAITIEYAFFMSMNNYDNNIKILRGKTPSGSLTNEGYIEVVISNDTAMGNGMVLGRTYQASKIGNEPSNKDLIIKVVGIYNPIIGGASGIIGSDEVTNAVVCDNTLFKKLFIKNYYLHSITWDYLLDYTSLNVNDLNNIEKEYDKQKLDLEKISNISNRESFAYNGIETIKTYNTNRKSLGIMFFVFSTPMFFLLLYCIFFISKLIVEMDKTEISILQSRGASRIKIGMLYFLQSITLVAIPLLASPFLATALCRILGNTIGFLEFGRNIPLSTSISLLVCIFDVVACLLTILTILIPSLLVFNRNLLRRKNKEVKISNTPFWKKFYFDFIFLAISGYGYYSFVSRQKTIVSQNMNAAQLPIDPLTFLVMLLFLVAMGLFFLRIYSFFMKIISHIGKKFWSAPLYYALQRVSVIRGKEQFIILFMILTLSLGVFNANAARTINKNLDDYLYYDGGSEIVLKPLPSNITDQSQLEVKPPLFKEIIGVKAATMISTALNPQIYAKANQNSETIKMIGIEVRSYSQVAWSRPNMLKMPFNYYLNLLAVGSDSCIISKNLADKMNLSIGEDFMVNINSKGSEAFTLKVVEIVEAWPGYTFTKDSNDQMILEELIITNTKILEDKFKDLTYEIWLKTENNASIDFIEKQINERRLFFISKNDYKTDALVSQNSAERQSLNALISLSFAVIFLICFVGFLIYWFLSIKSRVTQLGTLRAMGLSSKNIYMLLFWEQLFITLIPLAFSILIGGVASRVFVNILKITFGADMQVLPFEFFTMQGDFIKIYLFIGTMIIITFGLLLLLIKQIQISQVIKLGEE